MRIPTFMLDSMVAAESFAGHSARGPTYSGSTDVAAYVELGNRKVIGANGDEIVCNLFALTAIDAPIAVRSRLTVSGRVYEVIDVQPADGHHMEIYARSVAA